MRLHGLELAEGETAFAFCVLRLRQATARTALLDLVRSIAPLIPDAETVIEDLLPEDLEQAVLIIAVPWQPPLTPAELGSQHALLATADVDEAWFFQTGTSLPPVDDDDDSEPEWSHGVPPQRVRTRFPVDGTADVDTEDVGIAIKLAGDIIPGEGTVLLAFHTLWLAPYGGRYRNSAVTIDRKHHSAHLWVDRFEVASDADELVGHLFWIVSKLDEVVPVVHARFASATMAQKYGELLGDEDDEGDANEPFVLGGNPLMAAYALGGEAAVDRWIAEQTAWSKEEVAQMLREIAVEIVTATDSLEEPDDDEDDDEHGRAITMYAADILRARAERGRLDPRATARLIPLLAMRSEHQRQDVISILGASRAQTAVPALVDVMRKQSNLASTAATALGHIGDSAAVDPLSEVLVRRDQTTVVRAAAANALVACASSDTFEQARGVVDALLEDAADDASTDLFAIGQLARGLPSIEQARVHERLQALELGGDAPIVLLAREAALVVLGSTPSRALAVLLHECLTSLDFDQEATVRKLRFALRVAAVAPSIVEPADLGWLTTFNESDVRAAAHALLVELGQPLPEAPMFHRYAVRELDDDDVIALISESRVIGRAALIAEAARRRLARAVPPVVDACHDVISRARHGAQNLLDSDARVLEVAVPFLRGDPDGQVIALFDRMLRHPNYHVKWELLNEPPLDERLITGMFHVLGEKWGWQETTAKEWLANFQGTPSYERERRRVPTPHEENTDEGETNDDDQDMN